MLAAPVVVLRAVASLYKVLLVAIARQVLLHDSSSASGFHITVGDSLSWQCGLASAFIPYASE